jgi:high-affinity nickel-transport protein
MLGTAVLAWGLGLRHAVDADHIAAIDNVTRKRCRTGSVRFRSDSGSRSGIPGIIAIASIIAVTASALSQFGACEIGGVIKP